MACPSTQVYHQHGAYLHEIWAWFAIGSVVLALRMFTRLRTVGWRNLRGDDHIVLPAWLCLFCDSITVTIVYKYGSNLDYTEERLHKLMGCQVDRITIGSQMQLLAWYSYTLLIWLLKAMMLFFFYRLTFGLGQQRLVKTFAVITALTYLAVFLTISCGCFPIQKNWQVLPLPPLKCTGKLQNFYVTTILNVLTDAMILLIPIPLLWGMKASLWRKIGLSFMLCSGVFVIAAAIMRISFTMTGVNGTNINRWGTRETAVGIIAVNMPILRAMFRKEFWHKGYNPSIRSPSPASPQNYSHSRHSTIGSSSWFKRNHRRNPTLMEMMGMLRPTTAASRPASCNDSHDHERGVEIGGTQDSKGFGSCTGTSTNIFAQASGSQDLIMDFAYPNIRMETSVDILVDSPSPPRPAYIRSPDALEDHV